MPCMLPIWQYDAGTMKLFVVEHNFIPIDADEALERSMRLKRILISGLRRCVDAKAEECSKEGKIIEGGDLNERERDDY